MQLIVDNPVIVKHLRSRLRPAKVVPEVIAIVCLCGAITWIAVANTTGGQGANGFLVGTAVCGTLWCLLAIVLLVLGAEQVSTAVSVAREAGILDFHRISPLSPVSVALGFFLGAPIREYCYAAVILPFLAITSAVANMPAARFVDLLASLLVVSLAIHASQLLAALVSRRPRGAARGITLLLVVTAIAAISGGRGLADLADPTFFGVQMPWSVFLAIHACAATLFLLVAATRRTRDQRAPLLSKWQALACMATTATLAIGCLWNVEANPALAALLPVVVAAGLLLCLPISVTTGEYLKGVRRARRNGHRSMPPMADTAAGGWTVGGLCVLAAAAAMIMRLRVAEDVWNWAPAWAVGIATIAAYGFAVQFFRLRSGMRGDATCHLLLFFAWVMPLPIASALSASGLADGVSSILWQSSPWIGMFQPMLAPAAAGGVPWPAIIATGSLAIVFWVLELREAAALESSPAGEPRQGSHAAAGEPRQESHAAAGEPRQAS